MHRPTGVTVLGWIAIVWGALRFLIAVIGVLGGLYATTVGSVALNSGLTAGVGEFSLGLTVVAVSFLGGLVAIGEVAFGAGLLALKRWAWILGHVLAGASIALNVAGVFVSSAVVVGTIEALVSILVSAGVIFYLHRPHVKAVFARRVPNAPAAPFQPPAPPSQPPMAPSL